MEALKEDWTRYWTDDEVDGPRFWASRDALPQGFDPRLFPTAVVIEWHFGDDGALPAAEKYSAAGRRLAAGGRTWT